MPSAIVTGATGILGREVVQEMSRSPLTWPTVHALSRSKKEPYADNVIHNHIDLSDSVDDMTKELKKVSGEYLFYTAYVEKGSEQESWNVNGDMLEKFLQALEKTGASKKLQRIILVTGCKQYGVHLGQVKNPMEESDPWLRDEKYPPNFYYRQQDILHSYCKRHSIEWVVTYPNDVIGFAKGNFMNLATSLGLYVAVSKEMGGGEIEWPGSEWFYTGFDSFTYSKLHAQFCLWAALEPRAANQAFNVVDGDVTSWQTLFPKVANYLGARVKPDQFKNSAPLPNSMDLLKEPPIVDLAEELGLAGKVGPSKVEQRINLAKWSQQKEVQQAWAKLADKEGLEKDVFEKATWAFLDFVLGRNYNLVISMSKARRLGWTGYIDSWDALETTFDELVAAKVLPKTTKTSK